MKKAELCESLMNRALDLAQRSYDELSRTHIVYCLEVGKFGIRGIGAFADDAFDNFKEVLEAELNSASLEQLGFWFEKLNQAEASEMTEKPLAPVGGSVRKQIGLVTGIEFHDLLKEVALSQEVSQSQLAGDLIETIYEELNSEAYTKSRTEIKRMLRSAYKETKGDDRGIQWGVRIQSRLFTKIALFAREFEVTVPEVCSYLLKVGLDGYSVKSKSVDRLSAAKQSAM